jgi:hypothetical protein
MATLESIYIELINFRRNNITTVDIKASPMDIEHFLKSKGFVQLDIETNGWEHDFTIPYEKDNITINHRGSWYYGNSYLTIIQKKES